MNKFEKALKKKKGKVKDEKEKKIGNMVEEKADEELGEKGRRPKKEFGAKNNDSQED